LKNNKLIKNIKLLTNSLMERMKAKSLFREGYIEDFYAIDEEDFLGEGGSAIVRRAISRETGNNYAIKILDK
jgi:hypothetical protein